MTGSRCRKFGGMRGNDTPSAKTRFLSAASFRRTDEGDVLSILFEIGKKVSSEYGITDSKPGKANRGRIPADGRWRLSSCSGECRTCAAAGES